MSSLSAGQSPTSRQLEYLGSLAGQAGITVPEPATRSDASSEITRLEEAVKKARERPTFKQLRALRALAIATETSFSASTRTEASAEIERLKKLEQAGRPERKELEIAPWEETDGDADEEPVYGTAFRDDEVVGVRGSATFAKAPEDDPVCRCDHRLSEHRAGGGGCLAGHGDDEWEPVFDVHAPDRDDDDTFPCRCRGFHDGTRRRRVGERRELARYHVTAGDRVLYAQTVGGVVRVTDCPGPGSGGRAYLVDRVAAGGEDEDVGALVAEYLGQAKELDAIPMATSVLGRDLREEERER